MSFSNDAHYLTLGLLADEDRYYSQGLHLFWNSAPHSPTGASGPVRRLSEALQAKWISSHIRLGQEIFTPNDIRAASPLVSNDRAFAGWTHLDWGQRFYFHQGNRPARLHLQINLGVVGPASLAEEVQIGFHRMRRQTSSHPELDPDPSAGWDAQYYSEGFPLKTQFILNHALSFYEFRNRQQVGFDFGGEGLFDFGNLYGHAGIALQARAGRLMRSLYLPMPEGNQKSWEAFGFARTEIKAVAWNGVLTGAQSHNVTRSPWLWQNEFGAALRGPSPLPELSLTLSMWSRETKSKPTQPFQPGHIDYRPDLQNRSPWFDHGFGTVRLAWYWD